MRHGALRDGGLVRVPDVRSLIVGEDGRPQRPRRSARDRGSRRGAPARGFARRAGDRRDRPDRGGAERVREPVLPTRRSTRVVLAVHVEPGAGRAPRGDQDPQSRSRRLEAPGRSDREAGRSGMNARLIEQLADATLADDAAAIAASLRELRGRLATYTYRAMKVGIIGLGYVGLPLAVAFAEAGCEVVGVDADAAARRAPAPQRVGHRGRSVGAAAGARGALHGHATSTGRLAACDAIVICVPTPLANHREPDLTYLVDAATPALAASCTRAGWSCSSRRPIPGPPASACSRSSRSPGWPPAASSTSPTRPSGSIPGRTDHTIRTTPKVVGGLTEECRRARRGALPADLRRGRRGLLARGRGAHQAAREHLPLGQHRARQRARPALRPDGHRRLGGRRRRGDQAVRLHALRARARAWAATACRSIRSTSPSRPASTTSTPSSSSSPGSSTRPSRSSASRRSSAR